MAVPTHPLPYQFVDSLVEDDIIAVGPSGDWKKGTAAAGIPAGADTEIQFNKVGAFGADDDLTFVVSGASGTLNLGGTDLIGTFVAKDASGNVVGSLSDALSVIDSVAASESALIDANGSAAFNILQNVDGDFSWSDDAGSDVVSGDAGANQWKIYSATFTTSALDLTGAVNVTTGGKISLGELNTTGQIELISGDGVSVTNAVTIDAPAAVVTAWTLTVPPVVNTAVRQVMMANDTSGNTVWGFIEKFTQSATSPVTMLATTEVDMGADIAAEAGTIVEYGVRLTEWTVDISNTDTLTVRLYVNGSVVDSFTSTAGAAGFISSGAVIEAYAQDAYIEVKAEITTQNVGLDTIKILCWIAKP